MYSDKERIKTYLKTAIDEMDLVKKMSADICKPNDFGLSISGMTIFRACGMSLQYITENFIKIRNKTSMDFFSSYRQVPWKAVFGMRNVIVHEYADIDDEAVFNTIKKEIPLLEETAKKIMEDLEAGKLDEYIKDK